MPANPGPRQKAGILDKKKHAKTSILQPMQTAMAVKLVDKF